MLFDLITATSIQWGEESIVTKLNSAGYHPAGLISLSFLLFFLVVVILLFLLSLFFSFGIAPVLERGRKDYH